MTDEFIHRIAKLMEEQAVAYTRLDSACVQLSGALVRGEPSVIESLTRAGESELLRMRSRLVEIMGGLAAFADARESAPGAHPLSADARAGFESASGTLSGAAGSGTWTVPSLGCSGRWTAQRRSPTTAQAS